MNPDKSDRYSSVKEEYKGYTAALALFDALPVVFFLISGIVLHTMYASPVFFAGVMLAFAGGLSKVIWKLIIACRSVDISLLTRAFRLLMPGGFCLMIIAVIISAVRDIKYFVPAEGPRGNPGTLSTLEGLRYGITMMPAAVFFLAGIVLMCLMGYWAGHLDSSARSNWIEEITNACAQLAVLAGVVIVYFGSCYHADMAAADALRSSGDIVVIDTGGEYFFDGPGTDTVLIFYPGAKVEPEAYSPLMRDLAENGVDCFLCKMPLNFSLLDSARARDIRAGYGHQGSAGYGQGGSEIHSDADHYENWYLVGHSLGGVAAAMTATEDDGWSGIVFLASYPTKELDIPALSIYGSEDQVLNMENYQNAGAKGIWPEDFTEEVIEGGNHAGFGSYGEQQGDGNAVIAAETQQADTAGLITDWIENHRK